MEIVEKGVLMRKKTTSVSKSCHVINMNKPKNFKNKATLKKVKPKKTNPKGSSTPKAKNESASNLREGESVTGSPNHNKKTKHLKLPKVIFPETSHHGNKSDSKISKLKKTQNNKTKFKKDAIVKSPVKKRKSSVKASKKKSSSLPAIVGQMAEEDESAQHLAFLGKDATKKKRIGRNSNSVFLPSAASGISFPNETPLERGAKRRHSLDAPHVSSKRDKPTEQCLNSIDKTNIPSKELLEKVHLKKGTKCSKSILKPNTSQEIQPTTSANTVTFSLRAKRALIRQSSKDMKPSGGSLVPQNKVINRCKPDDVSETLTNLISTSDKTQHSNLMPGFIKGGISKKEILNRKLSSRELVEYEEVLWNLPLGILSDSDEECTEEDQANNISEGDNPFVESKKEVEKPTVELASVSKYSFDHFKTNGLSVGSMLVSSVKECNVRVERLSPKDVQTKINSFNNQTPSVKSKQKISKIKQTSNTHANELLHEANDHSPKTATPLLVKLSCEDVSDLCPSLQNHKIRDQPLKSPPTIKSLSTGNSCIFANEDVDMSKIHRPKLTKSSILKRTQKRISIKTGPKQIRNEVKHGNELERTVVFKGTEQNIMGLKITKSFSDAGFQNIGLGKEKIVSCTEKKNFKIPIPNNNYTSFSFNKQKSIEESPLNNVKQSLHQRINLRSVTNCGSDVFVPGRSEKSTKLQNSYVLKSLKKPITFNEEFGPQPNKSRARVEEVQKSQVGAMTEQDIKFVLGTKGSLKKEIENIHMKIGEVENGRVEKLVQTEDKIGEKLISPEHISRNVVFDVNKFQKVANYNLPGCSTNNRSFQDSASVKKFSFKVPNALPKKVTPMANDEEKDNDDLASVLSLFVSDELMDDVDSNGKVPNQNTTSWNKFDRYNKNSEDKDECITCPITSSQNSDVKFDVVTESAIPSRIEKCALWNQNTENFLIKDWRQTISFRENPNNQICDDPPKSSQDSLVKDYCLLYLRMSIQSHDGCNLIHKVPYHLFSGLGIQDDGKIDRAINYIAEKNFTNPPEELFSLFVSCCVKLCKRTTLVRLGKCLRYVNKDKANQLWFCFLKAILDTNFFDSSNSYKCHFISTIFGNIFEDRIDFRKEEDIRSLKLIQSALIKVHAHFKSEVKLLICLGFMSQQETKNRLDLRHISPEFAVCVVKQCLEEVNNQPDRKWRSFAYKVSSNFFFDCSFVESLYNHDKHSVLKFIQLVESRKVVDLSSRNYKIKQLLIGNGHDKPSLESRTLSESRSPISNNSINMRSAGIAAIENETDSNSISAYLERSYDEGTLDPKEVYNCLKSSQKKETFFRCLSLLRKDVKETLGGVVMGLLTQEANKKSWANCIALYKSLPHWNFKVIKNLEGCNSPTANVLTIVLVLLMNKNITEALDIFCEYNLWKHEEYWILNYMPEDIATSKHICSIIEQEINNLDGEETLFPVTIKLVSVVEATLPLPMNVRQCVDKLLCQSIENRQHANILQLLYKMSKRDKIELLTLSNFYLYRVLVIVICNEKDLDLASMLFIIAMNQVKLYPTIPIYIKDVNPQKEMCIELYSSLRNEEIKVIVFAVLKLFGTIIQKSGFFVKFKMCNDFCEEVIPGYFKPHLSVPNSSVPYGIKRFRDIVRELIPDAIFITRGHDGIEIDKISLKEYVSNQTSPEV